jgi:hypothetical protein
MKDTFTYGKLILNTRHTYGKIKKNNGNSSKYQEWQISEQPRSHLLHTSTPTE